MALVAKFTGGPRAGKKNNLRNHDEYPNNIAVPRAETKAANMAPGRYVLAGITVTDSSDTGNYTWVAAH